MLHKGLNSHYKTWSYSKREKREKDTGKLIKITLMVTNAELKIVQIINQKKIKNSRLAAQGAKLIDVGTDKFCENLE